MSSKINKSRKKPRNSQSIFKKSNQSKKSKKKITKKSNLKSKKQTSLKSELTYQKKKLEKSIFLTKLMLEKSKNHRVAGFGDAKKMFQMSKKEFRKGNLALSLLYLIVANAILGSYYLHEESEAHKVKFIDHNDYAILANPETLLQNHMVPENMQDLNRKQLRLLKKIQQKS